ncbi:alpha/beta fold hydrolase [Heliophilum fasciatum]|uniref:Sigma-B regulation protein RsbQ n=1 Tax=Heliophilum fasciatum TaxID=35700 RepID=A0A4R2RX87_9FIRM|nr:alpha/beta hydrolase [Heliophilum fasciatum]MCW2277242.1 sigma-B regulation protein RsbQ [Heliophilum fasciatum]TCP68123.1 sigma-B regulation protein RsbQ [Heliophilum fasciatum]
MKNILSRNNVNILGKGKKTILFGHGFGCDQNIWRLMIPYFEDDYRIVLFDYVGSGKADVAAYDPQRYSTLHGYARDVIEILEALAGDPVIFIGHSVSGMLGLLASIQRPGLFAALIMLGASPRYINDLPDYYGGFTDDEVSQLLDMMEQNFVGWASVNAAALMNQPEQPHLTEQLKAALSAENALVMHNFAKAIFLSDHRKYLAEATVPTLIVQCSEDSIVPIEVGTYLHNHIKNSVLKVTDTKGHYPHISQPQETAKMILNYITGTSVSGEP